MNVMATEDSLSDTNAQTPTSGECGASEKPVSWSAPQRASSRWRSVVIAVGIILAWLVLFIVLASPIFIDLWMSRSSATCDSPSSLSSFQSPSEIK